MRRIYLVSRGGADGNTVPWTDGRHFAGEAAAGGFSSSKVALKMPENPLVSTNPPLYDLPMVRPCAELPKGKLLKNANLGTQSCNLQ